MSCPGLFHVKILFHLVINTSIQLSKKKDHKKRIWSKKFGHFSKKCEKFHKILGNINLSRQTRSML